MKTLIVLIALLIAHSTPCVAQLLSSALVLPVSEYVTAAVMHPGDAPKKNYWGMTALAIAGPLADGVSTYWALKQSGPLVTVSEGNGFFQHLFGSNVTPGEILAFKIAQAGLMAVLAHFTGEEGRTRVNVSVGMSTAILGAVSVMNVRNGRNARRINATATVAWGGY